jgi:hypothetical protein
MTDLIIKALQAAGYTGEPTEANLIECYLDYADCLGGDIEELREDIAEGIIKVKTMCNALIRCN